MPPPRRLVVVDDDPAICSLLTRAFEGPDFEVYAFGDPLAALAALPGLQPDLVVCDVAMPGIDGRTFLERVRRSGDLHSVPFVLMSGVITDDEAATSLAQGADDFVSKPFHVGKFVAKVRAMLRLVDRRQGDALTGEVGADGILPLLRFCEQRHLTGRLTVTSEAGEIWAEFEGGELTKTGGRAQKEGEDPFDTLVGMTQGRYIVEQRPLDGSGIGAAPERPREDAKEAKTEDAAPRPAVPPSLPPGRLSRVEVRGDPVEIQTEGENRPNFTVTTVVARGGHVIRKIENAWTHPLGRREDRPMAESQIERQHTRVVAMLQNLEAGKRAEAETRDGDPPALACALSFVAEQVRLQIGNVMVAALLRSTLRTEIARHPVLRHFTVAQDGNITPLPDAPSSAISSGAAVGAVAAWTTAFLQASGGIVEKADAVPVRDATRLLEEELERCHFYSWLERLAPAKTEIDLTSDPITGPRKDVR